MALHPLSWLARPWLLRRVLSQARLASRLLREPQVPLATKLVPAVAGLYLLSPVDAIPDLLPMLGHADDLAVIAVALGVFIRLCPPSARLFHERAVALRQSYSRMTPSDDFIDAGHRV